MELVRDDIVNEVKARYDAKMQGLTPEVAGGMVRFDFVTIQPEAEGKAPSVQPGIRVIMPPQGFLGAFNSMQQLIDKLLEAGVLQKTDAAKK